MIEISIEPQHRVFVFHELHWEVPVAGGWIQIFVQEREVAQGLNGGVAMSDLLLERQKLLLGEPVGSCDIARNDGTFKQPMLAPRNRHDMLNLKQGLDVQALAFFAAMINLQTLQNHPQSGRLQLATDHSPLHAIEDLLIRWPVPGRASSTQQFNSQGR